MRLSFEDVLLALLGPCASEVAQGSYGRRPAADHQDAPWAVHVNPLALSRLSAGGGGGRAGGIGGVSAGPVPGPTDVMDGERGGVGGPRALSGTKEPAPVVVSALAEF